MVDPDFAAQRTFGNSEKYRNACLGVAKEWRAKAEEAIHGKEAKEGKEVKEGKGEEGGGWRVGVIDLWEAILVDSGGKGEELRPYFA